MHAQPNTTNDAGAAGAVPHGAVPPAADKTDPAAAAEAKKLRDSVEPYFEAIKHRIDPVDMPQLQKAVIEGLHLAMAKLGGRGDGSKMVAWRKAIDAVGPKMAAEILGVVLGIVDMEVRRRTEILRNELLADLS